MFLVNSDDKGFVGNAIDIANTLDQCEETFDNVLFNYKYIDALQELVDKRLALEFVDKANNRVFLIRHWFYHNNFKDYLSSNYISLLSKVDLVDSKYQLRNNQKEKPKEKKIKENKIKENKNSLIDNKKVFSNDIDDTIEEKDINNEKEWEQSWEKTLKELENIGG